MANYFEMMTKRCGENWVVTLNPEQIQRNGKRIIKEMAKGQIDYEKYGTYFLDMKILDNLIISCQNELQINEVCYNAIGFYMQYNMNILNITAIHKHMECLTYIYRVILDRLQQVRITGNIGVLADIAVLLAPYKNHLN